MEPNGVLDSTTEIWLEVYKTLPLDQAKALDITYCDGATRRELARRMGVDLTAAQRLVTAALKSLRTNAKLRSLMSDLCRGVP